MWQKKSVVTIKLNGQIRYGRVINTYPKSRKYYIKLLDTGEKLSLPEENIIDLTYIDVRVKCRSLSGKFTFDICSLPEWNDLDNTRILKDVIKRLAGVNDLIFYIEDRKGNKYTIVNP